MKLKYEMTILELDGGFVAVADDGCDYRGVFHMNKTAADIIAGLSSETTEDRLTELLLDSYDTDEASARRNVQSVLGQLRENGLLEE